MKKRNRKSIALFCMILIILMPVHSALVFAEADDGFVDNDMFLDVHIPRYANSDSFRLEGSTAPEAIVDIYINGNIYHSDMADAEGKFTFRRILLDEQRENEVKVVARENVDSTPQEKTGVVSVDNTDPVFENITELPSLISDTSSSLDLSGNLSEPCTIVINITNEEEHEFVEEIIDENASSFEYPLSLYEGDSEIILKIFDKANNSAEKTFSVRMDSIPPTILEHNIDDLSPTYSREVTIRGEVDEPATISIIVNGKQNSMYQCSDGIDNDGDGYIDYPDDIGCKRPTGNYELNPSYNNRACSDGKDNDGDGYIDYPDDVGCDDAEDNDEVNFNGTSECSDGKDNDFDGTIDFNPSGNGDWGCTSLSDDDESDDPDIGRVYRVETDDENKFSQKVFLTFDFDSTFGDPSSNNIRPDESGTFSLSFDSTNFENDIQLIATDKAGLIDKTESIIEYTTCDSGDGGFLVSNTDIYPSALIPDHIFRGIAQISFSLDMEYIGGAESFEDISLYVETRELNNEEADEWDTNLIDPSKCVVQKGDTLGMKQHVTCTLKRWPPEAYRNITKAYDEFQEQERVKLPLKLAIHYTEKSTTYDGELKEVPKTQFICYDLDYLLDIRADPDDIPRELLNTSVDYLNEAIDAIDQILPFVTKARWIVAAGCFGMYVVQYLSNLGEVSACWDVKKYDVQMETMIRGSKDYKYKTGDFEEKISGDNSDKISDIENCISVKSDFYQSKKTRQWLCDRIFCPVVPSAQNYREEQIKAKTTSPCAQSDILENKTDAQLKFKGDSPETMCEIDYQNEWRSGCVAIDPYKKSKELYKEQEESASSSDILSSLGNAVKGLSICSFFGSGGRDRESTVYTQDGSSIAREYSEDGGEDTYYLANPKTAETLNDDKTVEESQKSYDYKSVTYDGENAKTLYGDSPELGKDGDCVTARPQGLPDMEDANSYDVKDSDSSESVFLMELNDENYAGYGNLKKYYGNNNNCDKGSCGGTLSRDANGNIYCIDNDGKAVKCDSIYIKKEGNTYSATKDSEGCFQSNVVQGKQTEKIIVDPTSSFINSVICVCIPAVEGYLTSIRNILVAIRNCFQSILVTGEFDSGICRAILTQYLCDFVFDLIGCIGKSFSVERSSDSDRPEGFAALFTDLKNSGKKVKQDSMQRYGNSQSFRTLFNERQLIHSLCLAAFGYDWEPGLDAAMSTTTGGISINSTGMVAPATRRFMSANPAKQGLATYVYHVGYFLTAGEPLNWRLELLCSTTNDCTEDDYENGVCDCAQSSYDGSYSSYEASMSGNYNSLGQNNGESGIGLSYVVDGGTLEGGESVGSGNGNPYASNLGAKGTGDLYISLEHPIRYDKVRLCWTPQNRETGKAGCIGPYPIKLEGGRPPAICTFNLALGGVFSCGYFAPEDGFVNFVDIQEMHESGLKEPGQYPFGQGNPMKFQVNYAYDAPDEGREVKPIFIKGIFYDENGRILPYPGFASFPGDVENEDGVIILPSEIVTPKLIVGDDKKVVKARSTTAKSLAPFDSDIRNYIRLPIDVSGTMQIERLDSNQILFFRSDETDIYYKMIPTNSIVNEDGARTNPISYLELNPSIINEKIDDKDITDKVNKKKVALNKIFSYADNTVLEFDINDCSSDKQCGSYFELITISGKTLNQRCLDANSDTLDWDVKLQFVYSDDRGNPGLQVIPSASPGKQTEITVPIRIACNEQYDSTDEIPSCEKDIRLTSYCNCGSAEYRGDGEKYCYESGLHDQPNACPTAQKKPFLSSNTDADAVCKKFADQPNDNEVCYNGQYVDITTNSCKCGKDYEAITGSSPLKCFKKSDLVVEAQKLVDWFGDFDDEQLDYQGVDDQVDIFEEAKKSAKTKLDKIKSATDYDEIRSLINEIEAEKKKAENALSEIDRIITEQDSQEGYVPDVSSEYLHFYGEVNGEKVMYKGKCFNVDNPITFQGLEKDMCAAYAKRYADICFPENDKYNPGHAWNLGKLNIEVKMSGYGFNFDDKRGLTNSKKESYEQLYSMISTNSLTQGTMIAFYNPSSTVENKEKYYYTHVGVYIEIDGKSYIANQRGNTQKYESLEDFEKLQYVPVAIIYP